MLIIQRPIVEAIDEEEEQPAAGFAIGPLDPGVRPHARELTPSHPALIDPRSCGYAGSLRRRSPRVHVHLEGVKEDVSDIILNLKDLVITSESDEPVTLRVDVRGPTEVTGKDVILTADVRVLNRDVHLATINAKARLAMDLTIERGKGYVSADKNKQSGIIGVIPVDAIFSPVRRVTFTVEPTRVEQSTDYDRLILDVETDGSLTPRAALSSAGQTLRALVELVAGLSDDAPSLELGDISSASSGSPDLDHPIEDLDLSERPRNCLKRAQINTIGELIQRTPKELLAITNFGQKSLDEVIERLDERGLALTGAASYEPGGF